MSGLMISVEPSIKKTLILSGKNVEPIMTSTQDVDEFELERSIDNSTERSTTGNVVVLDSTFCKPLQIN